MIEGLVERVEAGDDVVDELTDLAAKDPSMLAPYLLRLLDAGVLWRPWVLYRGADEAFQRAVVARIDSGTGDRPAALPYVLAQTRGPVVEEAFRRWLQAPPAGPDFDPYGRGVPALIRDGGWEFSTGGIRELCGPSAYRLAPGADAARAEGTCPWCASPLWTALDVDTTDPRVADALAHTGWRGRLRIATCHFCSCYGTTYTDVTPDGNANWSAHNIRPDHLPDARPEEPPTTHFEPAERHPTPHLSSAWDRGGSTLGGCPDWIQDPTYLDCPACGTAMDYVALIGGADLPRYGEGVHYLYLHTPCGLAATEYQQS